VDISLPPSNINKGKNLLDIKMHQRPTSKSSSANSSEQSSNKSFFAPSSYGMRDPLIARKFSSSSSSLSMGDDTKRPSALSLGIFNQNLILGSRALDRDYFLLSFFFSMIANFVSH
jgi:hypothetical protein